MLLALMMTAALAQETVDVGVVRDADVVVVQKLLYPKAGRTEISGSIGWMPFDPYLTTPNVQAAYEVHRSEWLSFGLVAGGGYGLPNAEFAELENLAVTPDAYRYLGSLLGGVAYAPLYGKVNVRGAKVLHYDTYVAGRAGATLESSVIPHGGTAVAPTLSAAIGSRFFLGEGRALRVELRDDVLVEHRSLTDTTHVKQNVNLLVGISLFGGGE